MIRVFFTVFPQKIRDKLLRLAAGCPIADGDKIDLIFFHKLFQDSFRCLDLVMRRNRINGRSFKILTIWINQRYFTAGTECRVDTQNRFGAERGLHQEIAQVTGKSDDGMFIGLFGQLGTQFAFERWF
jgi:hypothetical protein